MRPIPLRIPLVACAALSLSCSHLGSLVQKPTVSLRDVSITDIGFAGMAAKFKFDVKNPNPVGLKLARLGYKLAIDGNQLAEGTGDSGVSLPAQGVGEIVLPVAIRYTDFASSLSALFSKDSVPYAIDTVLGFDTGAGVLDIPLSGSGTLPIPKVPDVSLTSAKIGEIGLTGATIDVVLGMRNRNSFSVPVGALGYAMTVQGTRLATGKTAPTQLAANGDQPVKISTRIDFLSAGLAVASALKSKSAMLGFDGELDLAGYKMPVRFQQTLR